MENPSSLRIEKASHLLNISFSKFIFLLKSFYSLIYSYFYSLLSKLNPFSAHLLYFISISVVGFLAMKVSNPNVKDLDLFFTSVSATTVSSMSTIQMEVLPNSQLLVVTVLMFLGGEVLTSMIGLQLKNSFKKIDKMENQVESIGIEPDRSLTLEMSLSQVELGSVNHPEINNVELKCKSIKYLIRVLLCYLLAMHVFGSTLVFVYISLFSSAREVLKTKGLKIQTFSLFLTVSSFANCGFTPTNENMTVFSKNSGLLLILIPQLLLGNVLFAPCLHFLIWVLEKFTKKNEFIYLLRNHRQVSYGHLVSKLHCLCIFGTALVFILVQFILFCSLEWNSEMTKGLNFYERIVGSLFQVINSRHAGESVFDISMASPAILVTFIVMMYLPSYTSVCPIEGSNKVSTDGRKVIKKYRFMDHILFSQLSYLVIFIIIVCVSERDKMKADPLNFNVLNITLEIISAYGNVGFSTGYSCKRQLKHDNQCRDYSYGLVGRWSNTGKSILIVVMFFGRLKNFSKEYGKAWHTYLRTQSMTNLYT